MDIQMPVMNGYEATKEIRKTSNGETTRLLQLRQEQKRRKNKCLDIGMNDYIAKPIVKGAIEHTL
jgi:CheY-like chemotaxis protein